MVYDVSSVIGQLTYVSNFSSIILKFSTSSQDGGVGKHGLPPCATSAKITINYKRAVTQNCQTIELYGSQTTKKLKLYITFIQMGRRGGDVKGAIPQPRMIDKNQEGYLESKGTQPYTRPPSPGFQPQKNKSP